MFGLFGKNDWEPVWVKNLRWEIGQGRFYDTVFEPVSYEIQFSESRRKFRLQCRGSKPELHPFYPKAIDMLNDLKIKFENEISTPQK